MILRGPPKAFAPGTEEWTRLGAMGGHYMTAPPPLEQAIRLTGWTDSMFKAVVCPMATVRRHPSDITIFPPKFPLVSIPQAKKYNPHMKVHNLYSVTSRRIDQQASYKPANIYKII